MFSSTPQVLLLIPEHLAQDIYENYSLSRVRELEWTERAANILENSYIYARNIY